jgi:hypothetical protein
VDTRSASSISPKYSLSLLDKMHKEYPAGAVPDPLLKLADIIRAVMRPSVAAAASRKNPLLFDCESEAPQGIVDCAFVACFPPETERPLPPGFRRA